MKDPLQTEPTHYEVLGVNRGATPEEIEQAFRAGVAKRVNPQKLLMARQALAQPVERAMLDLFQYDPAVLDRLSPNPLRHPALLDLANRRATAAEWEKQLKRAFPDPAIAHALGVLWYWTAVAEETRLADAKAELPVDELWKPAIACWGMVLAGSEGRAPAGGPAISKEVAARVTDGLRSRLLDQAQKRQRARYQEMELALVTEIRTAKEIAAAGIRNEKGTISCGPLMLGRIGILDSVREQVESGALRQPGNTRLAALRDSLSPFSGISALLSAQKPQAAADAIEALPSGDRARGEVQRLKARAYLEIGKQQASLGQVDEALGAWRQALACKNAEEVGKTVRAEVVTFCQQRAAAIQSTERERAMEILEHGLRIVEKDEKLSLTLAEMLVSRAIGILNAAHEKVEKGDAAAAREAIKEIERGIADLDRAEKLGSERARENAATARRMLQAVKSGGTGAVGKAAPALKAANEAAEKGDWPVAVKSLRAALKAAPADARDQLRKNLAVALSNGAIGAANRAMSMINSAANAPNEALQFVFEQMRKNRFQSGCAICSKEQWQSDAWYTLNIPETADPFGLPSLVKPDTIEVHICGTCRDAMQKMASTRSAPPAEAFKLLDGARADLKEATKLDPANENARSSLKSIEETIGQVKELRKQAKGSKKSDGTWVGVVVWILIIAGISNEKTAPFAWGLIVLYFIVQFLIWLASLVPKVPYR
jgi:tetratricopeptide (TPR) repeat protein